MRTQAKFLAASAWTACALATGASGQETRAYKDVVPDTVWPGVEATAAGNDKLPGQPASGNRDTVLLRIPGNAASEFLMIPEVNTVIGWQFRIPVPLQAPAGSYHAYSRSGTLLETRVTQVADVAARTPSLASVWPARGFRSESILLRVQGHGLPFGPIPETGNYLPSLRAAYLALGSRRIPMEVQTVRNPYDLDFMVRIPGDADSGRYDVALERTDGVVTTLAQAFQVWTPPLPVIRKVIPESLGLATGGILELLGSDLAYGIYVPSNVVLDRKMVKVVRLSKGGTSLSASDYLPLGSGPEMFTEGILTEFPKPMGIPVGSYDVEIILNGRSDTARLVDGVRVVAVAEPALASVFPPEGGRFPAYLKFRVTTLGNELHEVAGGRLIRGADIIRGTYSGRSRDQITCQFDLTAADTGLYRAEIDFEGRTLSLPQAYRVRLPEIGLLTPAAIRHESTSIFMDARFRDYPERVRDSPGRPAEAQVGAVNVRRMRFCMGTQCLDARQPYINFHGEFSGSFVPGGNQAPGLYDLEVETWQPSRILRKSDALLLAPPGFQPVTYPGLQGAFSHFPAAPDKPFLFDLRTVWPSPCPYNVYRLGAAPGGMTLTSPLLAWVPGQADTGRHYVKLIDPDPNGCKTGLYLAIAVSERHSVAVERRVPPGNGGHTLAGFRATPLLAGGFRITLDAMATLELVSLSGRKLASHPGLPPGEHVLRLPGQATRSGVVLCRVRSRGMEAWHRLVRSP